MPARFIVLVVALALLPWAPARAASPADAPQVTDPTGDATMDKTSDLASSANDTECSLAGSLSQRICGSAPSTNVTPPQGGAPAPAMLDIVSVLFHANATTLDVTMTVASLAADFPLGSSTDASLGYRVCWDAPDASCRETLNFIVNEIGGGLQFDSYLYSGEASCQSAGGCYFGVPYDIVPGTPGTIVWHLPRSVMPEDVSTIAGPAASSWLNRMAEYADGTAYRARSDGAASVDRAGNPAVVDGSVTDVTERGADYVLPPIDHARSLARDVVDFRTDAVGDSPHGRKDLDLLNMSILETEKSVSFRFGVAQVDAAPGDHHFQLELQTNHGALIDAGFDAKNGGRTFYSGRCDGACSDQPGAPLQRPADITVVPGTPGWINVTVTRADLGDPRPGDTFPWFYVGLLPADAIQSQTVGGARVTYIGHARGDNIWEVPPWWFRLGKAREARHDDGVSLTDAQGDATLPPDALALSANPDAFDITALHVVADAPGELRVELGVADLSQVGAPQPYTGVFYAVGLATESGAYMLGYYDDGAKKEFLCAPDADVLTRPAADPTKVVWQAIQGTLSIARDRGAGGGSEPGSIVFLAPYSCFSAAPADDLRLDALAAGTFLLGGKTEASGVSLVDEAHSDGPVTITAAKVIDSSPWYDHPFGFDQFWNIAGIVAGLLVSLIGALVVARKRGALRRYLHAIERIAKEHAGDTRARERALLALQEQLKADLLRAKILEAHFVIVERRLEATLARLRTEALGDAFGDLPHRLLVSLQQLLSDGVMDAEDWRLFRTQLEAEPHLTPASREAILARVGAWVRAG